MPSSLSRDTTHTDHVPSRAHRLLHASALLLGLGVFLGVGWWITETVGLEHEEVSLYPTAGYRIVSEDRDGNPVLQPWCGQATPPLFVVSEARPLLGICVGGRLMPVMIDSYIGGVPYWFMDLLRPLHRGDYFDMRKMGLLLGLVTLLLVYGVVKRFSGKDAALVTTAITSATLPFVIFHATLRLYEVLFTTLLLAAVHVLSGGRTRARTMLAAALAGISLFMNIKAVLLVPPLLLLAATDRSRPLHGISMRHWTTAAGIVAATTAPMWLFALVDPQSGLHSQMGMRLSLLLAHLDVQRFIAEVPNLLLFWTDLIAFSGYAVEDVVVVSPWLLVPAGLALLWCTVAAAAHVLGKEVDTIAAACGVVFVTYVIVVVLLYDQTPDNYMPLHTVFGIASGSAVMAGTRALARLGAPGARFAAPVLASALVALYGWNGVKRGNFSDFAELPMNATAQHALVAHLEKTPLDGVELVTTTYNMAGVLDALGGGRLSPVQAQNWLESCPTQKGGARPRPDRDPSETCLVERWERLLERGSLRAVVPARENRIDEDEAMRFGEALVEAARRQGKRVTHESDFHSGLGKPVLSLYRVDANPFVEDFDGARVDEARMDGDARMDDDPLHGDLR